MTYSGGALKFWKKWEGLKGGQVRWNDVKRNSFHRNQIFGTKRENVLEELEDSVAANLPMLFGPNESPPPINKGWRGWAHWFQYVFVNCVYLSKRRKKKGNFPANLKHHNKGTVCDICLASIHKTSFRLAPKKTGFTYYIVTYHFFFFLISSTQLHIINIQRLSLSIFGPTSSVNVYSTTNRV